MTKTDAGFLAKHLEKLILGVGLIVLLAIAFLFLLREPYQVEIRDVNNRPQKVGPSGVEAIVEDAVEALDRKLAGDDPGFEVPAIPNYTAELALTYEKAPVTASQFAMLGGHGTNVGGESDGVTENWILPTPPVPVSVVASADYGLLRFDEFNDPNLLDGVQKLVGNQVPADVRYVSVQATFDMDDWRHRFERIPLAQRVPDVLYRNSMYITGVYLLRQEQDPISKRWGNQTRIQPVQGQLNYLPDPGQQFDRAAGENAVRLVKTAQNEIARPPFFPLDPARPWAEPGTQGAQLNADQRQEVNNLANKIKSLERRIELHRRRHQIEARPRPDDRNFRGEEFQEFDQQPGVRRPPPARAPVNAAGRDPQAQLADMEAELAELQRRRTAITAGRDPDADPLPSQERFNPGIEGIPPHMLEQMSPEEIEQWQMEQLERPDMDAGLRQQVRGQVDVWGHDLTVKPGHTYRYKVVATVLNPLFQNRQLPEEQAEQNEHRISLTPTPIEIEAADWSEPVKVESKYEFFVVNGNPGNQNAEIEVYTVFNGARQVERFQVQPGDPIGQVVTRALPSGAVHNIDLRVGAVMVDIVPAPGGPGLSSARMLYLDPETNRIAVREVNQDKNSRRRQLLEFEVNQATQARADDRPAFP